jgi:hypothetical protein
MDNTITFEIVQSFCSVYNRLCYKLNSTPIKKWISCGCSPD